MAMAIVIDLKGHHIYNRPKLETTNINSFFVSADLQAINILLLGLPWYYTRYTSI